jgi:hypothetical protein
MQEYDAATRATLRRTVFALRSGERRRVFAPRLHVGDPDGDHARFDVVGDRLDDGLRSDVVGELLRTRPEDQPSAVWLTRTGVPKPHDVDLAWLPSALAAFAEAGETPRFFVVVTKSGWYDPRTDERTTWQRLRIRR